MQISSKLPEVGTTIFTVMTQLALKHGAINLSQGYPDFDAHPDLIELVTHYMHQGCNQYAPMQGVPALRSRIAEKTLELYGARYNPDTEICVTSGATEALFCAITAVVHPGDEVILFEPAYDAYAPVVRLCGGHPRYIRMCMPDYGIDWDEVRKVVTPKTRLMVLNSPHNPTGMVLTGEDMAGLLGIVRESDIVMVSDEVYEHIIFDGLTHESLLRHPELAARSFVISSFGKTYHTTGWKMGYCLAPEILMKEFLRVRQFVTFTSNTPIQYAYADFMTRKELYLELGAFYQAKRDQFLELIKPSRFKPLPCSGTYFQMLDYSAITDEADTQFSRRLTIDHGVATIPPSVFYHDRTDHKVLRFCFAKSDDTLAAAAEKLCTV